MSEKDKEKKNAKEKYFNKNSTKNGILSVVGAITHKLGISSIWVISNLATYVISYLKQKNQKSSFLSLNLSYFFNPILTTTLNIFMPICGILEFKLGCQRAIILGALVIMLGYGLFYISGNIFLDFFAIFFFGIGLSISTTLSTKNAIQYFFNQRGAISGILELISSGLSATHNKIAESMINPKGEDAQSINGSTDKYYSLEISEKVLNFFILELGTYGISTLLTLFFLVPFDEKAAKKFSKEISNKRQEKPKEENNTINDNEDEKKKDEENVLVVDDYNRPTVNKDEALIPDDEKDQNIKINRYEVEEGDKGDYDVKIASEGKKHKKVIAIPDTKAGILDTIL